MGFFYMMSSFVIFSLWFLNQTEFRLVSNQSGNGRKHYQIPVYLTRITRRPPLEVMCPTRFGINRNDFLHSYTQRNLTGILSNQIQIRLYLPCTDWFGTIRTAVWFQINFFFSLKRSFVNFLYFFSNIYLMLIKRLWSLQCLSAS